jgi:hypothetical protein
MLKLDLPPSLRLTGWGCRLHSTIFRTDIFPMGWMGKSFGGGNIKLFRAYGAAAMFGAVSSTTIPTSIPKQSQRGGRAQPQRGVQPQWRHPSCLRFCLPCSRRYSHYFRWPARWRMRRRAFGTTTERCSAWLWIAAPGWIRRGSGVETDHMPSFGIVTVHFIGSFIANSAFQRRHLWCRYKGQFSFCQWRVGYRSLLAGRSPLIANCWS